MPEVAVSPEPATIPAMSAIHAHEWFFDFTGIMGSTRKITGTFHVPTVDKDNEIITSEAMYAAMDDYMHFPTIAEYHKERPFAIVTKAWKTTDDEYALEGLVKMTEDCNDIWEKVQKGEYNMMSVAGKRTDSSAECTMHPLLRGTGKPCITRGLRLDSISACDEGARNPLTSLEMAKAGEELEDPYLCTSPLVLISQNFIKATDTDSSLIHTVTDGIAKKRCGTTKKCSGGKSSELEKSDEESESKEEEAEEKDEVKKPEEAKKAETSSGVPEEETAEKAEDPYQEILKILRQLVASDKKVHAEKAVPEEEEKKMEKSITDGKPGQETPEEVGDARSVTKANLVAPVEPAEFAKALTMIETLKAQITALESQQVQKAAVVIIKDTLGDADILESDASVIIKANGGKV